jgi:hypothetical protein
LQAIAINVQKNLLLALHTVAEDGEVAQVSLESVFAQNGPFDWIEDSLIKLKNPPALPADQVVMMSLFHRMVAEFAAAEVGLSNQSQLLEQFQGSIHGGYVDVRVSGAYLSVYFLSADMVVAAMYCGEYHQALWSQPVALFS